MTTTPNGARIVLRAEDGSEHDVTDAVGSVYDLLCGSMDWGSGFITIEDAAGFVRLVDLAGYDDPELRYRHPTSTRRTLLEQARDQVAARDARDTEEDAA